MPRPAPAVLVASGAGGGLPVHSGRGRSPMRGQVEEFDGVVGLGSVRAEDGQAYLFHCTRIADGSRDVEVGTSVGFDVVAGHLGRWEAAAIRSC